MKKTIVFSLIVIFLLATVSSVMGTRVVSEERITTDTYEQSDTAIYGDIVVWNDYRNSKWDIYVYNMKTNEEIRITTNTYDNYEPAIYGDIVVWHDYRNGNWDIYLAYLDVVCKTKKSLPMQQFMKILGLGKEK